MTEPDVTRLPPTRDYAIRIRLEYGNDKAIEVEGLNAEDIYLAINAAVKTMWRNNADALSLDDMRQWLDW